MNQGSFTFSKYNTLIFNGIISLTLLLFFASYFIDISKELALVILVVLSVATFIMVLRYKQMLLYGLSFFIPLSVPVTVLGESKINLPSEMICVLLSGFFFIKLITGSRLPRRFISHPITILILCDLAWLFISSVFSQMPEVSFKRFIIRICYYITFYYFYHELFRQHTANIKKVFTLHATGFLIPIAYTIFRHAQAGFSTVGSDLLAAPFYYDHTIYGACIVFFIPFLVFYAFNNKAALRERTFYMVLLCIFLLAAWLSYSRAAWISLLAALAICAVLKYRIRLRYLLALAGLALLISAFNWQKIITSLKDNKEISHSNSVSMHFKSISNVNTDASNKERINRWKCALRMFADKPLAGFGPGTYQFFYGQYQHREDLTRISTYKGTKGHAHSEYLNYLSETGLPGLLIFVTLIVTVCIKSLQVIHRAGEPLQRDTALFIFTGLITFFIHALFNGFLEFEKVAMPVFCSMAVITFLDSLSAKAVLQTDLKQQ